MDSGDAPYEETTFVWVVTSPEGCTRVVAGEFGLVGSVVSGDAPYEETTFVWVVTRMDTSKSGWTPHVYYTTLYSTPRYTIFRRIKVTRPSFCGGGGTILL